MCIRDRPQPNNEDAIPENARNVCCCMYGRSKENSNLGNTRAWFLEYCTRLNYIHHLLWGLAAGSDGFSKAHWKNNMEIKIK